MISVALVKNESAYDAWLQKHAGIFAFLQSSSWKSAITRMGRTSEIVEIVDDQKKIGSALLDYHTLPFGTRYAVCPKGPIIDAEAPDKINQIYTALVRYAKTKKCIFLRVEPVSTPPQSLAYNVVRDVNPRATLVLSLTPTAEELLANMHTKTRYNIRLAEKKGVQIEVKKSLDTLWSLMQKTGERDKFRLHPKESYQAVLSMPEVEQLNALVNGTAVATGVFIKFGTTYTYLYGASDHEFRDYMSPLLLQWTAVQRAKAAGATQYDFFGIAPTDSAPCQGITEHPASKHTYNSAHRYAGVTRFKLGFGGVVHEEPGTFDVPVQPAQYALFKMVKKIRQIF